ncbi:MAG TPA: SDR family oxidoreductase [Polyangia bacterium]|nr:SDR family oxidoreductase [Polyangia bacterium]
MGEIAVVTGAASGVGAATVDGLVARGIPVIAVTRRPQVEQRNTELVTWVTGDVSEPTTWSDALEACQHNFGDAPSMLVLSAATLAIGTVLSVTMEEMRRVFEVNVFGAMLGLRACLPGMIARGGGAIVTVASTNALFAEQGLASYCSSKGALLQLTRCVAVDHGRQGIRAICVCPGAIDTPFFRRHVDAASDPEAFLREKTERHPSGKILEAQQVADAILFFLSPAASGINGASLLIDGGLTASFDFQATAPGA